jgi:hypothetical protein
LKSTTFVREYWKSAFWIGAVVCLGGSYWYAAGTTARLATASDNLQLCEQLAQEIRAAQKSPQHASLETWTQDDLGTAVESAAADAKLARDRVLRIDPQAPKRLGKTDYLEQATEVELLAVPLRQLVDFLFVVSSHDDQLAINTLRMRVPHEEKENSADETWLADIVLTQRIYAPTTPHH